MNVPGIQFVVGMLAVKCRPSTGRHPVRRGAAAKTAGDDCAIVTISYCKINILKGWLVKSNPKAEFSEETRKARERVEERQYRPLEEAVVRGKRAERSEQHTSELQS